MTFRRHIITSEPVLYAPERASRPGAFTGSSSDDRCPFCPGHETDTPPSIAETGRPWRVRVFPNKYPPAPGAEVIVESAAHEARFHELDHAPEVVETYVARYRAHGSAAYTAVFRNDGAAAGSSIDHGHSQVVPVPFVPPRIARELEAFAARGCPLCEEPDHVIGETESFRWIAPSTSWMPYQQWLVPRRHVAEMSAFRDGELAELASLLRGVSAATSRVAPAFNWAFINFPGSAPAHAYVEVLPRMTAIAGFELATGTFVEIIDPARAAETLRR